MRLSHRPRRTVSRPARAVAAACALLTIGSLLAGCASSKPAAAPAAAPPAPYPVTVTSCGIRTTYDQAPRRAVSNDIKHDRGHAGPPPAVAHGRRFRRHRRRPRRAPGAAAVPGRVRQGPRRVTGLLHARDSDRPEARFPVRRLELRLAGRHQPHPGQPGQVRDQDARAVRVLRPRPAGHELGQHQRHPTRTCATSGPSSTSGPGPPRSSPA
jgi:hypothetical protein